MWFDHSVFYQMYPLALCGAPERAQEETEEAGLHRLRRLCSFIPHLQELGIGAVYLNPVFESDSHGYDTRDYRSVDRRLGTNEDMKALSAAFHTAGIRLVLDGVFNHVGRGFFAFRDLKERRQYSPYRDWFRVSFDGDSPYGDGFWYEGWEGHYELVKLNLENPQVQEYLMESIDYWFREFDIDGIRLDVAYLLPLWFIAMIKDRIRSHKPDAFLLGEILGDNARRFYDQGHVDAITDYPLYKGLWSSFNSLNLFELAHTVKRSYGEMYRGLKLFSFADNHDVERIASRLDDPRKLPLIYALLFTLPGIPCLYYGSEWGQEGKKQKGSDASLRPAFEKPAPNEVTERIARMIALRNATQELSDGNMTDLRLFNRAWAFMRELDGQRTVVVVNLDDAPFEAELSGAGAVTVPPLTAVYNRRGAGFMEL